MEIQGKMKEFIRELIGERWIKERVGGYTSQSKQTDFEISQGGLPSVIFFLLEINGVLGELRNGVDGLLFACDLTVYITKKVRKWHLEYCKE